MRRAVLVVCDSLRADMVTPELAPTLAALGAGATRYAGARGVFPSVTRVSSASMATGCHPGSHGLLGNTMVIDEGAGLVCLSVGKPDFRERLRRATGRTLHRPTMAERLARHGGAIVMSNVSPGAAYFQDPDGWGHVYHRAGSFEPGLRRVADRDHLDIELGAAGDWIMTARFCDEVLRERRPALAVLWLSEPDHTGHHCPLGSPAHRAAIAAADHCVARVLATVRELRAAGDDVLLVACSDHGMETTLRTIPVDDLLVAAGLKAGPESTDVVVAPNGTAAVLYRSASARATTADLARFLSTQDWAGRVFVGAELAGLGMPTAEPVACAVSLRAVDEENAYGVRGMSDIVANPSEPKDYTGFGQHGGLGDNEQRPFLFVWGRPFPEGTTLEAPVCHVDLAPTILDHLGVDATGMDGRPLPRVSAAVVAE
jgi:arylsulfatase A-like enzyme